MYFDSILSRGICLFGPAASEAGWYKSNGSCKRIEVGYLHHNRQQVELCAFGGATIATVHIILHDAIQAHGGILGPNLRI